MKIKKNKKRSPQLVEGYFSWGKGKRSNEGKWGYIPELKDVVLLDGVTIQENGIKYGGKRKYYSENKEMDLEDGWIEYKSGTRFEGKWGWSTEEKSIVVTFKTHLFPAVFCFLFFFLPNFKAFGGN